jgi:hypothetical protein
MPTVTSVHTAQRRATRWTLLVDAQAVNASEKTGFMANLLA